MKKTMLIMMFFILASFVSALNCSNLTTDIQIDIDPEPYIVKENSFLATLPTAYKTHSVKCWTYVKSMNDEIQQTNPQVEVYSDTFFSRAKKTETREYFTAQNGMVNPYFTQKNLVSYTQFVLGIRCVSENNGDLIIGEKCITPTYQDMKQVTSRSAWAVPNMEILVILFISLIIVVIIAGWIWRKFIYALK